jgi:hypothetical protein
MTADRHAAFTRARDHIASVAAAKLFADEREVLDNATEDLLLADSALEADAALAAASEQLTALVDSGRWTATMRAHMLNLLEPCGARPALAGLPEAA